MNGLTPGRSWLQTRIRRDWWILVLIVLFFISAIAHNDGTVDWHPGEIAVRAVAGMLLWIAGELLYADRTWKGFQNLHPLQEMAFYLLCLALALIGFGLWAWAFFAF